MELLSNSSPLVEAVVTGKWKDVVEICKSDPGLISDRATISGETALHMAISEGQTEIVKQLVELMRNNAEQVRNAATAMNELGNTPLHLAAVAGSVEMCRSIGEVDDLGRQIACRNRVGETPLFLAVYHGMKDVFLYLQSITCSSEREGPDYSLCKREDGTTILQSAIARDHLHLAFIIINAYPDLVDLDMRSCYPNRPASPLCILAAKPSSFRSGSSITGFSRFIYDRITVNKLEYHEFLEQPGLNHDSSPGLDVEDPNNTEHLHQKGRRIFDRIKERKEKHVWSVQILDALLERTSVYDDDRSGRRYYATDRSPLLVAVKNGITEIVERYLARFPVALFERNEYYQKNIVQVAVEHRQAQVYELLLNLKTAKDTLFCKVGNGGNSVLHLAAERGHNFIAVERGLEWPLSQLDAVLHMQRDIKWFQFVRDTIPNRLNIQLNDQGKSPEDIFTETHKDLVESGVLELSKVSESCCTIAGVFATVAFATSSAVSGGLGPDGTPNLQNQTAFYIFAMASLIALCSSIAALAIFLTIWASRFQESDFRTNIPLKLLVGVTSLALSTISVSISFCAGHFFIIGQKLKYAALPIYAVTIIVVVVVIFFKTRFLVYSSFLRSRY